MDSSSSQVFAVNNILLNTDTKWNRKIEYPKSWKKVYENMSTRLNQFPREIFAKQEKSCMLDVNQISCSLSESDLDDISIDAIESLNREIKDLVQMMIITDEKASHIVKVIVSDLNKVLRGCGFIKNKWSTFGSYKTGLGCINSDVDLYFENIKRTNEDVDIPSSIASCLKESPRLFSNVNYIINAQIPIIKLKHIISTGKKCDISFSEVGVKSSVLSKFYVQLNPSVKVLTLILKLLLIKYRLYGTNRMTTHVIFWLVIFFLQQKELLPPVKDVRKKYTDCKETELFEGWNFSVNENFCFPSSTRPNSSLLLEFAKFYKDFDFEMNVISSFLGYTIPIKMIAKWKIPEEILPRNLQRFNSDGKNTFRKHVINMQEPSILSSNLSKSVKFEVVNCFKILCNELVSAIEKYSSSDNFLALLPEELPCKNVLPRDLMQCTSIEVNLKALNEHGSGDLKEHLCRAIHRIMGTLQFGWKSTMIEDVFQVEFNDRSKVHEEITIPTVHLSYSSISHTWKNSYSRKLLLFPNRPGNLNEGIGRSVKVHFVGVIDPNEKKAIIMIQTDLYLCRFFQKYGSKMLQQTIFA